MTIKRENKIALAILASIYTVFTVVYIVLFPEQSVKWHLEIAVIGLFFILLFGLIVRGIDLWLDKYIPFERNILKRIMVQFLLTFAVLVSIRLISAPYIFKLLPFKPTKEIWIASFAINLFMVLSLILSIFGYHFVNRWKQGQIAQASLEREKAMVQYDNLRNQLNPHFLFNSLSSLNSLIFENPQLASDFLQQLSKVYRYVLENKNKSTVTVQTEINFVSQYAHLLKTRFANGLNVNFDIQEDLKEKRIAPVTLQVLLENAVKHNITSTSSALNISVFSVDDYLVIENNLQKKHIMDTSNGQGLENLKNLYSFLSERPVVIEKGEKTFAVKVPLLD